MRATIMVIIEYRKTVYKYTPIGTVIGNAKSDDRNQVHNLYAPPLLIIIAYCFRGK